MKNKAMTVLAAVAATAAGMMSSPSGQEVVAQVAEGTSIQQASPSQNINGNQNNAINKNATTRTAQYAYMNPYVGSGGNYLTKYRDCGIYPKDYGLYLARSGKNKQNALKRKHYEKMRS
jgi:hypothetical protein